jgi:uncharacterized protein YbjT (DUF2867 family)
MPSALLLGASGLIGGHCLAELLADPACTRVVALTRRALPEHPKLAQVVSDLRRPETLAFEADEVYSCLGTTRAAVPDPAEYRRIDLELPLAVAGLAARRGAKTLALVTAVGADPQSRFFYPRLKGELEARAAALPFRSIHVFRPSFLLGRRGESRPLERAFLASAKLWNPLMAGPLAPYRAIPALTVAKAMIRAARSPVHGFKIHQYAEMTP